MIRRRMTCLLALLLLVAAPALSGPILLVQGTTSIHDKGEHGYAGRLVARLDAWLQEFNLPTACVTDDQLNADVLKSVSTVILPYNPHPDRKQLDVLKRYTRRGGKIIVFYSASKELAGLMGLRLGEYKAAGAVPRWWAFQFGPGAPAFFPGKVYQDSRNIRPVYPRAPGTETIAMWEDRSGKSLGDPAWVRSPYGFWMTHVLLDNGARWPKKQMLLAAIAANDPGVWKNAAVAVLSSVRQFGHFRGFDNALVGIEHIAREETGMKTLPIELARARSLHAELQERLAAGDHGTVVVRSKALHDLVAIAYGRVQVSREREFRGLWDHSGLGLYPGDWDRTCRIAASHGFTDIFPNLQWAGLAHYKSNVLPRSAVWRRHGDQARLATAAAHKHGLALHAWKICWKLGDISEDKLRQLAAEGRLQQNDKGVVMPWLCPSNPKNLAQEVAGIRELLVRYRVDGIHLDYIRFPGSHTCYCKGCRLRFEAELGRRLNRWPDDVRSGLLAARHDHWRRTQITRLVERVRETADRMERPIRISAAVYGKYPSCARSVAQDWGNWLRDGLVDFVCPMNYTADLSEFTRLTRAQLLLPRARGRVYPGIGATASQNRLGAMGVIDQIRVARREGAQGFAIFQLDRAVETEILPVLGVAITRKKTE
jgi:uncharacterized lipoprotein YddW (UPF0748 family)